MNRVLIFAAAAIPMLADASLKGAALLVLAGGCVLVMRRASASARHMVWLAAMVALLIVPVLSVVLPGWRVLPRWSARDAVVAEAVVPRAIEKPAQTALPMERPTVFPAVPPLPVPEAVPVLRPNVPVAVAKESVMPILHYGWLLPIWAAGCSVLVLRLAAAHVLLRRSTWRCESADGALVAALEAARVESGVSQSVRLLLDKDRTIPVVWGIFRPQLLLPAEAEQWNATQLRSVLLHELAHLRRRDPLTQLLTQLACALHWFNPLVWLAAWRLHVERERACDDLVLARGVKPSAYAEHLLQIATQLSPARWTQACGLAMARKSSIEGRLHAVLSDKLNRRSVTRALTAAALMLGALIAVPLAMLRAADEKWNPPGGAHIGGNDFSAVCVHDGKESSFVIAYRGDFDSMSNGGSNAKARTWTNSGTITLKKPGVVLSYHRVHTAPGKLSLTTGPSEGRDLGKAALPVGNFGQKEYDLAKGRVFLLSDDATVRQLDLPTPLVTNWENAEKLAQLIAERLPEEPTDMARPKHKDARALYELWQRHARLSGDIPGALIGELAAAVKVFIGYNPTWETVPKLNEILPRLDATHDWKAADAIALLDEVAAVQDSPLQTAAEKMTAATIRQGEALPERFASATWGETQSNGLRAAWVLEPGGAELRMGTALKARLLVQNAGTIPVMVRVPTWHQGAVSGRDATGAEVEVSGIEWTTIARLVPVRLGPGEFIEINAPGVGLGKDAGRGPWAGPRVGSNVLAKDGGELILTHGAIPLDGSGVGMREDAPHLIGPGWWQVHIKARIARELPLPASGAKRTHLLDRAVRDLFATTPTPDEVAAFAADRSDGAFDALVQRLAARADRVEFSGSLPIAPVKFRVLPADPEADRTPRVVLGPGEYPLSGGTATSGAVTLKIVGRPVGDRRTNDAQILFEATEATGKLPPSPHKLEIPDGWGTWAIVCRPGEGFIYLLHKDGARKIDYSDPAKITDLPATVVPAEFRDEVKRQFDIAGVPAESLAEVFEQSAPPASETGEARPPERTHLWNEKYAAVAYQTEKDVSFVLVHEGFISTGIGESSSQTSGKWSIEGNIHLVDSKLTAAAGKNVDKRVIAVKHTSDEPGTLYLGGKAYALDTGCVFVLGYAGEPFQTARSMALRTKEDLVKIGDMVIADMKRAQPATTPEPKQTGAVLPITDGKSSAQVLRADGYEPIVILTGRALTVLPESSSREGGLTMDVATSDKTITVRYIWPEDAPGFLGLKAGGYPVSRFDLSRGRVFYVHFEKMEFAAEIFQVPAGVKVPAIDSPAALTAAAAAVTAWYASCDDRARWESSRVVVPESEFKSGKPLDAAADKIVWGEASDAGLRLGLGGLDSGGAYPVGQSLPVKQYIRNDSGKTIGFSPTQIFNEGVGGELVRKADGKKFPHQRGYPGQGFFDRVRLAPGHYIELGSGPMRTIMAEKDGSSPGGMDMMAHGFTVLPGEYTLQLTHGIGQFLGRPANSHFGDPRSAPGLGEWTGVLTSAAVPLRLADEQVKTAKAGDSEAFGSQYMIAFDKGVIRLRHYKGYPGMSHSGGPWEDGSRDWKIPAADGEYVAAWAVGGTGLWVKDASGITHLIVKDNLTENGKWTLEQASGGRGDIPAGVRAALQLPPATAEPFDFKRLPNSEGAAMMEGGFFEMALSEGRVLKVPQKGSGFFIESGGRAYGPADGNPVIELGLAGLIHSRLSETPNTAGLEMLRHMIADGRGSIRDCAFRLLPDLKAPQSPFDYDAVFWAMIGAAIEDENGPKDLTPEARMGYAWMHGLFHSTRLEWERTRPSLAAGRYQSGESVSADAGIVWTAGPDGMSLGISGLRGGASLEIGKSVPVVVYLRNDTEVPVKLSVPAQHNPVLQISLTDAAGKAFRASYPFSPGVTGYRHYELAAGTAVKVAVFDLEAHATPDDASRAAHKEGKEHNPRLAVPAGSYKVEFEYRNYQESPVPKDAGAEWTGKVTGSPVPLTIATAVAAPAPEAPKTAVKAKPQNESAQSLFRKWQAGARTDGKIPGGLIGELARTMDDAVKQITDAGVSAKLAALRPRLDASRDWTQAEVVALLDEITAIATAPVSWADDAMQSSLERVVRQGEPLPKELESAAWGAPAANGLRAAWLLEPGAEQYPLGSVLKARVLFHNVGKEPVVFETETWHQDDGHTARDGQGAEMPVKATWFTGITPTSKFRLAPGEYCEVSGHGLAIGAGEYKDEHSTGAVGAIIEAKEGEPVTLTHSVDAGTGGWTRPDDLWVASIARRVGNEAPMPASTADREQLIRRVTLDILGDPPTAEEIAAFAADASADALEKLIKRLQAGGAAALPWKGRLPTGETKFRVVAADPDAAKRPRSASEPGRYVLGDGVHLQVTQVTEGDRLMNSAEILFFGPDPKKESPHKPYQITLPEGARVYGIGWVRGAGELWVIEKDLVRRYDFRDPRAVKEVRFSPGSIGDVPEPLRGAMQEAFGELAVSGQQQQRAPGSGARRVVDWGKFPAYDELDRRFVPEKALELAAKAELDGDEVRSLMFMILQGSVEKAVELQPLLKDEQLKRKDDEYHSLALALAAYDYSLNGNREALQFLLDQLANGPAGDVQAAVPYGFMDEWELTMAAHEKHFARGADGAAGESYGLFWEQRRVLYPEQLARYQEKALKASGLDPESRRGVWTGSMDGVNVALRFGDDVSWRVNKGEGLGTAAATTLRVLPDVTATHLDVMVAHGKEGWVPCGRVSRGAGGGLQLEIWPHTSAAPFLPRISGLELTKRPAEIPGVSREAVLLDSDVEARLAWGEPVKGLRAALVRISPGGDVKPGTVIDLNVLVQNVSDQPVPFRGESPVAGAVPRIVLADGTVMDAGHNIADILSAVNDLVLPPRHVVVMTLMSMAIGEFGPDTRSADPNRSVGYSTGKLADGVVVAGVTASLTFGHGPANAWKGTLKTGQLSAGRVAAGPVQPASK